MGCVLTTKMLTLKLHEIHDRYVDCNDLRITWSTVAVHPQVIDCPFRNGYCATLGEKKYLIFQLGISNAHFCKYVK